MCYAADVIISLYLTLFCGLVLLHNNIKNPQGIESNEAPHQQDIDWVSDANTMKECSLNLQCHRNGLNIISFFKFGLYDWPYWRVHIVG